MNTALALEVELSIVNPIVVTEVYDKPISRNYFVYADQYEAYLHAFFARPLSERLLARTFTILPV